jgi:hypothetical protein
MENSFDFTPTYGKPCRPSAARILAAWKKAGKPNYFTVEYGETFAEFQCLNGKWFDGGNGCRGVDRNAVLRGLIAESKEAIPFAPRYAAYL